MSPFLAEGGRKVSISFLKKQIEFPLCGEEGQTFLAHDVIGPLSPTTLSA